ncbi:hypothetical protein GCM10009001_08980 [Virgibacillus siamensis]|uniref:Uncharacterized protein n=1 Tax=Virgibacillus siamensis TaxID=480071 RepID=A0ABP3QR12_9BACI
MSRTAFTKIIPNIFNFLPYEPKNTPHSFTKNTGGLEKYLYYKT